MQYCILPGPLYSLAEVQISPAFLEGRVFFSMLCIAVDGEEKKLMLFFEWVSSSYNADATRATTVAKLHEAGHYHCWTTSSNAPSPLPYTLPRNPGDLKADLFSRKGPILSGNRTRDLSVVAEAKYQLSYRGSLFFQKVPTELSRFIVFSKRVSS